MYHVDAIAFVRALITDTTDPNYPRDLVAYNIETYVRRPGDDTGGTLYRSGWRCFADWLDRPDDEMLEYSTVTHALWYVWDRICFCERHRPHYIYSKNDPHSSPLLRHKTPAKYVR